MIPFSISNAPMEPIANKEHSQGRALDLVTSRESVLFQNIGDTELWKGDIKPRKDKFPTRAFTLYDSYIHTEFYNNKFFDYPNSGSILIENFQEN